MPQDPVHFRPSRRQLLTCALAACAPVATWAQPASWPHKVIRILVPNPAGGTADLLPRLLAEPLAARLGQSVIVENKPGAAGNIAAEFLNGAEPDGHILMSTPPTTLSINISLYPRLGYDPTRFVPVSVLAVVPNALLVHPSLPVNSVQELIALAQAQPDKLSYASQGSGSTAHLTAELFKMKTGLKITHVPYKGDAPAIADLLAGHVQMMFGNVASTAAHVRSGKLRALAVTSGKRLPGLPGIPAMNEIVPGVEAVTWFAMVAPPRTPMAIAERLSSTIAEILRTPDVARRYAEVGAEPVGNTPQEMAAWMKEDTERWRAVIRAGNIKVD